MAFINCDPFAMAQPLRFGHRGQKSLKPDPIMVALIHVRAAKWDPQAFPPIDEVQTNNFPVVVDILDIPSASSNITYCTIIGSSL